MRIKRKEEATNHSKIFAMDGSSSSHFSKFNKPFLEAKQQASAQLAKACCLTQQVKSAYHTMNLRTLRLKERKNSKHAEYLLKNNHAI
jgi:hypothetical protein